GGEGRGEGRGVGVGRGGWVRERGFGAEADSAARRLDESNGAGRAKILVGVDGRLAGGIVMADRAREDAPDLIEGLRRAGVRCVAMVTGDREATAGEVGLELRLDRVYAERSPEEKLEVVRELR